MGLLAYEALRRPGDVYADPTKITELVRIFENGNPRALAASFVQPGPHLLRGFTVYNSNASTQYILVFDNETLPADTEVPLFALPVATKTALGWSYAPDVRSFRNGIVLCNSSTDTTKTIGAADCFFDVQFL